MNNQEQKKAREKLGQLIARLPKKTQQEFLETIADLDHHLARSVITSYVIASIKTQEKVEDFTPYLEEAVKAKILTKVIGDAPSHLPRYTTGEITYVPASFDRTDKQALAILKTALSQRAELLQKSEK